MSLTAETLAAALALSIPLAALSFSVGLMIDRMTGDPYLRAGFWRLALQLPVLPILLVALNGMLPHPVAAPVMALTFGGPGPLEAVIPASDGRDTSLVALAAFAVLAVAAMAAVSRAVMLAWRTARVIRLQRGSQAAPEAFKTVLAEVCRRLGVQAPHLRLSDALGEPLLTGIRRPMLILPASWSKAQPDGFETVLAHEAAHLRRRDHLWLWLDEAALCVLAASPLMPALRERLSAAREEACDAAALDGQPPGQRRAFAHAYLAALEARSTPMPALSFAGEPRRLAMQRIKSILNPADAGTPSVRIAVAAGAIMLLAAGTGAAWAATGGQPAPSASEPPRLAETDPPAPGLDQILVNGAPVPFVPAGYGPISVTADEVRSNQDGTTDWRSTNGAPITGFAVDGEVQPDTFDIRSIDPGDVERIEIDAGAGYVNVFLRATP